MVYKETTINHFVKVRKVGQKSLGCADFLDKLMNININIIKKRLR